MAQDAATWFELASDMFPKRPETASKPFPSARRAFQCPPTKVARVLQKPLGNQCRLPSSFLAPDGLLKLQDGPIM
eukprot:9240256-Pyramimonas_sp.AAC.1